MLLARVYLAIGNILPRRKHICDTPLALTSSAIKTNNKVITHAIFLPQLAHIIGQCNCDFTKFIYRKRNISEIEASNYYYFCFSIKPTLTKMYRYLFQLLLFFSITLSVHAQVADKDLRMQLSQYFNQYRCDSKIKQPALTDLQINSSKKQIAVYTNDAFAQQPFRQETVNRIYSEVKSFLPKSLNRYDIVIYTENRPIEELIPNLYRKKNKDRSRLLYKIDKGDENAWVTDLSKPFSIENGLEGRHIAVGQSHGRYFNPKTQQWSWQRPNLFCTTEDLLTQSYILPYLIPMLENAGAYVFTPRERDTQLNEVIVDNDNIGQSLYIEVNSRKGKWQTPNIKGFAQYSNYYRDGESPFAAGSIRFAKTEKKSDKAFAEWIPNIPESGEYAVYVTYQSLPKSVSDAKYIIIHKGGITEKRVNQKMGGGTWVYLGTYMFEKGNKESGMVILTNQSKEKGVVCADAIRFGGGMGNIIRGGTVSGMPRYLEGARYNAQWMGMPYDVYAGRKGENDYIDDINVRSNMINYLSGESVYNPQQPGLKVPLELSLSLHTDAGHSANDETIGTLGIFTTNFNEGKLKSGTDRYASRDLADIALTELQTDINSSFNTQWNRRALLNANYSETRLPVVASSIIELLSHQNFADMRLAHDPNFKFTASRALYKAILKYNTQQHGKDYVVQPLPVTNFSLQFGEKKNQLNLTWKETNDPSEATATPNGYVVYTRIGDGGFDNGTFVKTPYYITSLEPGIIYSFKVTAVNDGGSSFPSEILSAYKARDEQGTVLIVNGFNRLSGPAVINTNNEAGFDINRDPGVPYLYTTAFVGTQQHFDRRQAGKEGAGSLGFSGNELTAVKIAGNSFDYPFVHGNAIKAAGGYSFVSCSDEAVENGTVNLNNYDVVDLILGLEKEDAANSSYYKTFTDVMQQRLQSYCNAGGKLLISGSYLGSDMINSAQNNNFIQSTLKYQYSHNLQGREIGSVTGLGQPFTLSRNYNANYYPLMAPESLYPVDNAFSALVYQPDNTSAAIAYKGSYRTFVMGFPFESISSAEDRNRIMASILSFFSSK